VIEPNLRLRKIIADAGADFLFHDCGELAPEMIKAFGALEPAMISFGSPVNLWEVESLVPKNVVIYGNMPTKKFYSDADVPLDRVKEMADEIEAKLKATGHPYIIGTECDVLSMPGYERSIMEKVERFCGCGGH
jgi:hypothetical protein